ncbi:MAG TPA: LytR C-terminal domain-containing protein [Gemmatimonadaceae bacterium]|nr:LytR C-terminal domain-containing protein [Gemmatimonadaceae bacterium]
MTSRGLRRLLVGLAGVVLVGFGWVAYARRHRQIATASVADARAPAGARIRVQVLNATKTHGLARRATMLLRDKGYDVVETGTVAPARDTTVVLDLSGHPDWARRVARALGASHVQQRPDSSRYLDIAVVLGTSWHPPAEPFYP